MEGKVNPKDIVNSTRSNSKKQYGIIGTLAQFKNSSLCNGALFIVMSFICLIASYMLWLRFISPSTKDFLYFLYNPSFWGEKFLQENYVNYVRIVTLSLVSWTGLLLGVKGIYNVLPQKIADSWVAIVVLLVFLLSPLGLIWSIWSFYWINWVGQLFT